MYAEGDNGDTAFIVVEGRCQTQVNVPKDADEINSDDESEGADDADDTGNADADDAPLAVALLAPRPQRRRRLRSPWR